MYIESRNGLKFIDNHFKCDKCNNSIDKSYCYKNGRNICSSCNSENVKDIKPEDINSKGSYANSPSEMIIFQF